jgi:hypothetical protein
MSFRGSSGLCVKSCFSAVEKVGERGSNRIRSETQIQQHARSRMARKYMKSDAQPANGLQFGLLQGEG